jgi:hypothetical protein
MKVSPSVRFVPTLSAAESAHTMAIDIARQIVFDIGIGNTIAGLLAPSKPYKDSFEISMARPKDVDLPAGDSEEDSAGLFVVICVSYASPASIRPRYSSGVYEITRTNGDPIRFKDRDRFALYRDQIAIRAFGIGDVI